MSHRTVFKTVFDTPLHQWPQLQEGFSLDLLGNLLKNMTPSSLTDRRKRRRRSLKDSVSDSKRPRVEAKSADLVVGLNQVTRALERNQAAAVIACPLDVSHPLILHHIPFQCHLLDVPLLPLPKGSHQSLGQMLQCDDQRSVHVLAILRTSADRETFADLIRKSVIPVQSFRDQDVINYKSLTVKRIARASQKSS